MILAIPVGRLHRGSALLHSHEAFPSMIKVLSVTKTMRNNHDKCSHRILSSSTSSFNQWAIVSLTALIPRESIKSLHFDNCPLFSYWTENDIEFDIYWKNKFCFFWYHVCWGNFMVDCPSLKLGISIKTCLRQI